MHAARRNDGVARLQGILEGLHLILALALLSHGHKRGNDEEDANNDENDDFHSTLVCQTAVRTETPRGASPSRLALKLKQPGRALRRSKP